MKSAALAIAMPRDRQQIGRQQFGYSGLSACGAAPATERHEHAEFAKATTVAAEFTRLLKAADKEQALRILGPAPAPLARIKGEHRLQVLIKTKNRRVAREALDAAMLALKEQAWDLRMLNVEVDPVSLM